MRLWLIGFVLVCIGQTVPAAAETMKNPYTQYRYASCRCFFGPSDDAPTCVPQVSCSSEGGRCGKSCPAQTGY